jgi:hypothetical protein
MNNQIAVVSDGVDVAKCILQCFEVGAIEMPRSNVIDDGHLGCGVVSLGEGLAVIISKTKDVPNYVVKRGLQVGPFDDDLADKALGYWAYVWSRALMTSQRLWGWLLWTWSFLPFRGTVCHMSTKQQPQQLSEQEIIRRRDEAVRRALKTPPQPYKNSKVGKRKPTSSQASEKKR